MAYVRITPEVDKFIIDNAANVTAKQASDITGIRVRRLWIRAKKLGVRFLSAYSWSKAEDDFLVKNAGVISADDIAIKLGRTVNATRERSRYLHVSLAVKGARGPKRNPDAIKWVLWAGKNYITWSELIKKCGVAKTTIYRIAGDYNVNLKIKRDVSDHDSELAQIQERKAKAARRDNLIKSNPFLYCSWGDLCK